ncbi:MAG: hypothetical protein JWP13_733 [Candidatus Saccharibacteria bacterium]|nr:hypothetical protein [Candidatus Saccharibacteria bacterium]
MNDGLADNSEQVTPDGPGPVNPLRLQHEKVIAPLHSYIKPEETPQSATTPAQPGAVTPAQLAVPAPTEIPASPAVPASTEPAKPAQPANTTTAFQKQIYPTYNGDKLMDAVSARVSSAAVASSGDEPPAADSTSLVVDRYDAKSFWFKKILKLLISGLCGGIIAASYLRHLATSPTEWINLIVTQNSPKVVLGSLIPMALFGVVYAAIQHFVLKGRRPVAQATVAFPATLMLIVALYVATLDLGHFKLAAVVAWLIGSGVFMLVHFVSQLVWSWRVPRVALAVMLLAVVFSGTTLFGRSVYQRGVAAEKKQQSEARASAERKAQGNFTFSSEFQLYYPSTVTQRQFDVIGFDGGGPSGSGADFSSGNAYLTLTNNKNDRQKMYLNQIKLPGDYNPPSNCYTEIFNEPSPCVRLTTLLSGDSIYKTYQEPDRYYSSSDFKFYMKRGGTLLIISGLKNDNTGAAAAIALLSGLEQISSGDLAAKAKNFTVAKSQDSGNIDFPVFAPSGNPFGLSQSGAFLDVSDPSSKHILLKYNAGSDIGTEVASFYIYKKPAYFAPPRCGFEYPSVGSESKACQLVATSSKGYKLYRDSYDYWIDCGPTVVFMHPPVTKSLSEVKQLLESLSETSVSSLNLQPK